MKLKVFNNTYSALELWRLRRVFLRILISPRRILNLVLVSLSAGLRRERVWGTPLVSYVEISSFCNLRCPMCLKLQKREDFDNLNMTMGQFRLIMDQIGSNALAVCLWNFGEPLMNPDAFEMIAYARRSGAATIMSTNGLLISPEIADKLVTSGLDFLVVSFDGATKESYEYNRRKGRFDTFQECMRNLVAARDRHPGCGPFVALQFVVMKTNEDEVAMVRQRLREWRFDKLMLRELNVVSKSGSELRPEHNRASPERDRTNYCASFWKEIVFNSSGVVLPCCMDAGDEVVLGHIYEQPLRDIWNGELYRSVRKRVLENLESIPICKYTCYKRNQRVVFYGDA